MPESGPASDAYSPYAQVPAAVVAPHVTSRDPWPDGVAEPKPVSALVTVAGAAGWLAVARYAARGDERTVSVRCARDGLEAVAMYRNATGRAWAWDSFKILLRGSWPRPVYSLADFGTFLADGPDMARAVALEWLVGARARKIESDVRAKSRDALRKELRARWLPGQLPVLPFALDAWAYGVGYGFEDVVKIINTAKAKVSEGR